MKKFWKWQNAIPVNVDGENPEKKEKECPCQQENVLFLHGTIAEDSWFDDDVTPQMFREELNAHEGDITVYINSPGGDCIAASEIYTMLIEHKGHVTVKIDGMAASAASVIAMAGTEVLMAPTALMMIHNPATMVFGDHNDMEAAKNMLGQVKDSIIKAYELKTNLNKDEISDMMEAETWMSADFAIAKGFADGILTNECGEKKEKEKTSNFAFSQKAVANSLYTKLVAKYGGKSVEKEDAGFVSAESLYQRLNNALLIK